MTENNFEEDKIKLEHDIFNLIWDFERKHGVEILTVSMNTQPINYPNDLYKYYRDLKIDF